LKMSKVKPSGYWTYERCKEESLKYELISEFKKKSRSAYNASINNNWIFELSSHMKKPFSKKMDKSSWTKETCREIALLYKTRVDFRKKSEPYYTFARLRGWLDEICSHMDIIGNFENRCVYVYEFPDNYAYVGLTFNLDKRDFEHKKQMKSSVYKHIKKTSLTPILKQLTPYLPLSESVFNEGYYIEQYNKKGFKLLNKTKFGSVGSHNLKLNKEICTKEALKYKTIKEFREKNYACYQYSHRHNWLDEICSHMEKLVKPNGYWTFERCREESLKYKTRTSFKRHSGSAYNSSSKNGWLDIFYELKNNEV